MDPIPHTDTDCGCNACLNRIAMEAVTCTRYVRNADCKCPLCVPEDEETVYDLLAGADDGEDPIWLQGAAEMSGGRGG